jgi:lipopolysaccharide export system permease protein
MRLLDRYLLRELVIPFGYCLIGFLVFWISSELFTQMAEFQKLKLTGGEIVEYYTVKTPEMLVVVLPIAFLLSLLYTLTDLGRHQELTAIRAAGVSLVRLAWPHFGVGMLLSLAVFAMNELLVPESLEVAEQILNRHQAGQPTATRRQWEQKLGFYYAPGQREWMIESYNLASYDMIRPHVVWRLSDGARKEILAERAAWANDVWVFTNLYVLTYSPTPGKLPDREQFEVLVMPEFAETPAQIKSEIKINKLNSLNAVKRTQLSIREIIDYRQLHPHDRNKKKDAMLDTKLHERFALPWTCLFVVLIALPFGAASGRRNVFVGVASSIVICFAYFVLQQLALALGTGGYVPPWISAWAPNALFGIVGLVLIWRVR